MLMVSLGLQHVSIALLLVLLQGTLLATIQQTSVILAAGISYINPDYTGTMVQGNGRIIMLLTMVVIAPLSLLHRLREVSRCLPACSLRAWPATSLLAVREWVLMVCHCCACCWPCLSEPPADPEAAQVTMGQGLVVQAFVSD